MDSTSPSAFSTLTPMLEPRSVAILGASDNPGRIGGRALSFMRARPFRGEVYPVNLQRSIVQGTPAYPDVASLPAAPDVAIVALPADLVEESLDALIARGTRSAVVFSSGFAEIGAEGAALQERMLAKARAGGMRLLGPNSLGLFNARLNFWGTFTASLEQYWPPEGRIGIASQSGAFGAHLLSAASARGLGTSVFVTTGNEADITTADAIGWMAESSECDVILSYIEGIGNGARLVGALEAARDAHKPVIMLKAGRSALGSQAAQSHTASLAVDDAVTDAVLRELGVERVESTQQALDFAYAAERRIYPATSSLGVLTVSGGAGIVIADEAEKLGVPMPRMPEQAQARLREKLHFAAPRNPVDCTAQALNQIDLVGEFGIEMMDAGIYEALLVFFSHAGGAPSIVPGLREQLSRIRAAAPERLHVLSVLAPPEVVRLYEDDGFLVFDDPSRAVAAIAAMGRLGARFAQPLTPEPPRARAIELPATTPNEAEVKRLLAQAGIAVAPEMSAAEEEEAVRAAAEIGLPVVMKILSPDILHKTEIGGVITDVDTVEAVRDAYRTLRERARQRAPQARIDGVLIARQISDGVECFMGVRRDATFGPVAVFGLGGVHVEVLRDVTLHRCPFGTETARQMIHAIRGAALLAGVRGRPPVDDGALAEMLSALSHLACALGPRLESIEINPVLATPRGAWAADGVIELRPAEQETEGGELTP